MLMFKTAWNYLHFIIISVASWFRSQQVELGLFLIPLEVGLVWSLDKFNYKYTVHI